MNSNATWFENANAYLEDADILTIKEKFMRIFPIETLEELMRDISPEMLFEYAFFCGYVTRELEGNEVFNG